MFFNLVWRETNPKLADICRLFFMLPQKFHNVDIYELFDIENKKSYELFGMVCYWGSHYICFFKSESQEWVSYDDTVVTKVSSWKELIIKCVKGHFHPVILFYKKSESDYSSIKESLIEEDMKRILDYAVKYDLESLNLYKQDEINKSLRPTSNDKTKSDIDLNQYMINKKSTVNNELISREYRNKYENLNSTFEKKNDLRSSYNQDKSYIHSYDKIPNLNEDEWICEDIYCKNVNLNSDYICRSKLKLN